MNDTPEGIRARFAPDEADIQVEVVDSDDRVLGTIDKLEAHVPPGVLHCAFSLFLFDEQGCMLLQHHTEPKYHSPLLLTNTTCSHPPPEEPMTDAIECRVKEKLGAGVSQLEKIGIAIYQAIDDRSGLAERKYNHVYASIIDPKSVDISPGEVDEMVCATPQELTERRANEPMTEWFNYVWDVSAEKLSKYGLDIAGVSGIHGPTEVQAAAQSVSERDV